MGHLVVDDIEIFSQSRKFRLELDIAAGLPYDLDTIVESLPYRPRNVASYHKSIWNACIEFKDVLEPNCQQ